MNKLLKIRKRDTDPEVILYQEIVSPNALAQRQHMFQLQCETENIAKGSEYYELVVEDSKEDAVEDPSADPRPEPSEDPS